MKGFCYCRSDGLLPEVGLILILEPPSSEKQMELKSVGTISNCQQ
jgi:hypothetical protein